MGYIFSASKLNLLELEKYRMPIIIACKNSAIIQAIEDQYQLININILLSQRLIDYDIKQRNQQALIEINNILTLPGDKVYLKRYQVLFTPQYGINVLKLFCEIAKQRHIAVRWCGQISDRTLVYSIPESKDYNMYQIDDYDVICLI